MAGLDIATGQLTDHGNVVQPLDPSASASPGVQAVTLREPSPTPGQQGPTMDTAGMYQAQTAADTAALTAAQGAGMSAETRRRDFYEQDIQPLGAAYGITMDLPPGYPDAGTVGGLTSPFAYFYDPPREGAPETFTGQQQ